MKISGLISDALGKIHIIKFIPKQLKKDSRIGRETQGSGLRSGATRELPGFGANPGPRGLSEKLKKTRRCRVGGKRKKDPTMWHIGLPH